jgi:hypothetical protein
MKLVPSKHHKKDLVHLVRHLESSESGSPAQAIRQAMTQECKNTTQTIIIEKTRESN